MKKAIFILAIGISSLVSSKGQYILFSNYYSGFQTTGITYGNGPAEGLGVGPEAAVTLLYGASTDTSIAQMTPFIYSSYSGESPVITGFGVVTGPGPILMDGNVTGAGLFSGGAVVIPGTPGSTYTFAIEAVAVLDGITYSGYSGIFLGSTSPARYDLPPNLPDGLLYGSLTITSVPEPASLALVGLLALMAYFGFNPGGQQFLPSSKRGPHG
jgi:hypothetical protein